jgi:hypothetical protein
MKIDKSVQSMLKRLDNILPGSSASSSKWDSEGNNNSGSSSTSNWDMINATIAEHEGDGWYIPSEKVYNAWTDLVYLTLGNIDLRNFTLERKFSDMRSERVQEYDRKWHEAVERHDKDYLSKHVCPGLANSFWDNWTKEEIEYYSNSDRFPHIKTEDNNKDKEYIGPWDKRHPGFSVDYSWLLRKYLD